MAAVVVAPDQVEPKKGAPIEAPQGPTRADPWPWSLALHPLCTLAFSWAMPRYLAPQVADEAEQGCHICLVGTKADLVQVRYLVITPGGGTKAGLVRTSALTRAWCRRALRRGRCVRRRSTPSQRSTR